MIFLVSVAKLFEALCAQRLVRPLPEKDSAGSSLELPKLSVVIPARNEERKLEGRCVRCSARTTRTWRPFW